MKQLLMLSFLAVFALTGCQTLPQIDTSALEKAGPKSILIIPPTNDSVEIQAPYTYLSTISEPVGEMGYYIFPVMIVNQFMQENGYTDPFEMHQIPLDRLYDVFKADTVLKINITDFGQTYLLLSSNTQVRARAQLFDLKTGVVLWSGTASASEGSGDGGGGLAGMMVSALVEQVIDSLQNRVRDVARSANRSMVQSRRTGLLPGPYYPVETESTSSQQ